jgi:hypothetical protein
MIQSLTDSYWAVVKVESGIPVMVSIFSDESIARTQEQCLRADMNLEDDETGVFQVSISDSPLVEPD